MGAKRYSSMVDFVAKGATLMVKRQLRQVLWSRRTGEYTGD